MAKKSSTEKTQRKKKLVAKYAKKRADLKKAMANPALDFEARMSLQRQLESLPLNSSRVRERSRCWLTGRARGYHRDLGLCRNALRLMAHQGLIPGMTKASW